MAPQVQLVMSSTCLAINPSDVYKTPMLESFSAHAWIQLSEQKASSGSTSPTRTKKEEEKSRNGVLL